MTTPALLHHALVTAAGAPPPARWMVVLHGVLGSGGNLRALAKRLAEREATWGFALVDLRLHGLSQDAAPPHTLAAIAEDLVHLSAGLPGPTAGALGHSLGGKSALAFAGARRARGEAPLDQLWVLDASPSARSGGDGTIQRILAMLARMPDPVPSRARFVELVEADGHPRAIAEWLAMMVRREGDVLRLRVDLAAIRELLADYYGRDLWDVVEAGGAARVVDFIAAGRSQQLDAADRARVEAAAPRARLHVLPRAGHWVHVDDPDGVFELVARGLRSASEARA